ncbi:MAG: hypothetical protein ACOZDD_12190 [Bacteroidota bacterium]
MKKSLFLSLVTVMMLAMSGCYYDWIVPETIPEIPVDEEISFSVQILPIFTTGNNCTSCHRTGGTSPDLSAGNAFAVITGNYINQANPEQSKIYTVPSPLAAKQHFKVYTGEQAALVLAWIKQGAKNN